MRLLWKAHQRKKRNDKGFTLIELLVVITILGILAAIVLFSVAGIGDEGLVASAKTDATILRTAEEAYCAQNGVYANQSVLLGAGYIATTPVYNVASATNNGGCGGTGYVIGGVNLPSFTSTNATAPLILAASNTTTPFSFLATQFTNNHGTIEFEFDKSSNLATNANADQGTHLGTDVLFASADEANINKVIPTGLTGPPGLGSGSCGSSCAGIASTKTQYTNGRLVTFNCTQNAVALPTSGKAAAPQGCVVPTHLAAAPIPAPHSVTDIVADLRANETSNVGTATAVVTTCTLGTAHTGLVLAIADPGTGDGITTPASAPYGLAAEQALEDFQNFAGANPSPSAAYLSAGEYGALKTAGCILNLAGNTTWGGTAAGGTSNVTDAQNNVRGGYADMALIPKSFVQSPAGNDGDNWTTVPLKDNGTDVGNYPLFAPIRQWAVALNLGTVTTTAGTDFLAYLLSPTGQAVLQAFGYDPIS